jgi:ribosomal protein S18 acetylase RimI-like enzyme
MIVRPATTADHLPVLAVVEPWWGRPVSGLAQRLFFEHFADSSLIAEDDAGLAGFLVGLLSQSRPGEAYIHLVGIRPDRRGSGLGRELYRRFFALAAARGCTAVGAITSPVNERSIAFHTALGFSTELVPDHAGPGEDRVVFRRELEEAAR